MSTTLGSILLDNEILLESGTNELEVLVFRVGSYRLGINVAKVREVMPAQKITPLPTAHPSVVGCFRLREAVLPCVSLHRHLDQQAASPDGGRMIVTEFNEAVQAFLVDEVERIHRVSWEHVQPVPALIAKTGAPVTAVTELDGRLVMMCDFETISAEVSRDAQKPVAVGNSFQVSRDAVHVLVADDSPTVRIAIESILRENGFGNVTVFEHGAQAWEWLEARIAEIETLHELADVLISDVEMPSMDGFHLTRRIKSHPRLKELPVILCSSIVTPANAKKGKAVGADAQTSKADLAAVVELADRLISERFADDHRDHQAPVLAETQA